MPYVIDGRFVQDHFPGIGRYVYNLCRSLARIEPDEQFRILYNPELENKRFDMDALAGYPNVELCRVDSPTFSLREQLLGFNRSITSGARLWHSAYYVKPYYLPVRSVVTLEDVTPLVLHQEMPSPFKRLVYRTLNVLAAQSSKSIITLSSAARDDIRKVLGISLSKIIVVPLAADARFRPVTQIEAAQVGARLDLPEKYALYLGSNKPHKNLVRLVKAWARGPTSETLVIAGHWDQRYPEARMQVGQAGLSHRVLFRPNIPSVQLPALIGGATLFVFPSLHEGFGLPPLEAMACGVPVVCSNASSLPEVVGDAALLFSPTDVEGMASALTRAIQDPALRDDLRMKGLAQAKKFSWERTARETLQVYRTAAGD